MKQKHKVVRVKDNSIAWELGIEPGDKLISINNNIIEDVFDYHYHVNEEELLVLVEKANGEEWELEIEKELEEDLGIEFESGLMDEYRSCRNQCMFCFIDQMPLGMRETLYFKDDDSRLSFLQGNYVTLTNMTDKDIKRIVDYHLEPINISIHTMNPELRCEMLHNRFAGEALEKITTLYNGNIKMNGQIVLCKGVNDGKELEYSIQKLIQYIPYLQSVSVVPVGLTKFREGLYELESFSKSDAKEVLNIIHRWQDMLYKEYGIHFIHGGDEWYMLAEEALPTEDNYDGYLQLENGVGMTRLLRDEFAEGIEKLSGDDRFRRISIATGVLAYPEIKEMVRRVQKIFPNIEVYLYPIENKFFGQKITVAGLVTGQDLISQLLEKELGETLFIPCNMLRSEEDIFLDDLTLSDVKEALQVTVDIVKSSGQDLIDTIIGEKK